MVEQPPAIVAMIASGLGKGIQQHAFLGRGSLAIRRGDVFEQLASAWKMHSFCHVCLLGKSPIPNRCANTTAPRPLASPTIWLSDLIITAPVRCAKEQGQRDDLVAE
jgi:hypothetical protein